MENLNHPYLIANSEKFWDLIEHDSSLEIKYEGTKWAEGPAWNFKTNQLIWSDVPQNKMYCLNSDSSVSIFKENSNYNNGNFIDQQGRLVSCQHGKRRIIRKEKSGKNTIIVDNYKGKKLNSPNDVVVKSDGTIWFTDPPYGIMTNEEGFKSKSELAGNYVFRINTNNQLEIICDDFDKPNGLAFSPDEDFLYIADSGASFDGIIHPNRPHHIRKFKVIKNNYLEDLGVFTVINPGVPDGFSVDFLGNIYTSSWDSIQIFSPSGENIGKIDIPEKVSNCCFGGTDKKTLYITASSRLYSIRLKVNGI